MDAKFEIMFTREEIVELYEWSSRIEKGETFCMGVKVVNGEITVSVSPENKS